MSTRLILLATCFAGAFLSGGAWAQTTGPGRQKPTTDAQLMASALSAGPRSITKDAAVMVMDGDKMERYVRAKAETPCAYDPASPGNDPMCLDRNAMEWLQALSDHKDAPKGKLGLVYMLQGGSDGTTATRSPHRRQQARSGSPRDRT